MKKYLLNLLLLASALSAQANTQSVQIVWPFSLAGAQPTMIRQMIDNANRLQNQYQFVFVNNPGAGGTVAANTVTSAKDIRVLITSTSFYIRPAMYAESHDPKTFDLIGTVCTKQPFAVYSKKYKNIQELSKANASIGVINGTISQLVSTSLQLNNSIKLNDIGYKGTPEAMTDMLGGHIDASVDFLGPMTLSRFSDKDQVSVIGVTGERNISGYATFKSQQIKGLEHIEFSMYVLVKNSLDPLIKRDISEVLHNSIDDSVKKMCTDEYGLVERISWSNMPGYHANQIDRWSKFVKTLNIEKQ